MCGRGRGRGRGRGNEGRVGEGMIRSFVIPGFCSVFKTHYP